MVKFEEQLRLLQGKELHFFIQISLIFPTKCDSLLQTNVSKKEKIKIDEKLFVTHSMILPSYCSKRTITRTPSTRVLPLGVGGNVGGGRGAVPTNE